MTTATRRNIAGAVGALVGVVSTIAGGRVLLGIDHPEYTVLQPLVVYNVAAGIASAAAGVGLMGAHRAWAIRTGWLVAGAHLAVCAVLLARYGLGWPVAIDSVAAMTFRAAVWMAIVSVLRTGPRAP